MEVLLNTLSQRSGMLHPFIFDMTTADLSEVPFHNNTPAVTRYVPKNFPMHMAVHQVSPVLAPPAAYTQSHVHDDCNEINIIIADDNLQYKIQLGENEYIVGNNTCIWIPRGTVHAANVLRGSGYFIAIRIN